MPWLSRKYRAEFNYEVVATAATSIAAPSDGWEVDFYTKTAIGIGNYANNPWLQEVPDPVSKVVWDHYATMNPKDMEAGGIKHKNR